MFTYRCNELIVLAPQFKVISYVRSQRSCRNSSKALAVHIESSMSARGRLIKYLCFKSQNKKVPVPAIAHGSSPICPFLKEFKGMTLILLPINTSKISGLQTRRGTAIAIFPTSSSDCIIFLMRA